VIWLWIAISVVWIAGMAATLGAFDEWAESYNDHDCPFPDTRGRIVAATFAWPIFWICWWSFVAARLAAFALANPEIRIEASKDGCEAIRETIVN